MAKRYVETSRWDQAWFRKLGSEGRDIWNWLHDRCDSAGVWEIDFERFSFEVGFEVNMSRVREVFGNKIYDLGTGRLWLPRFISFQYSNMSSKNRAQLGIMKRVVNLAKDLPLLDEETQMLIESFLILIRHPNGTQLTPLEVDMEVEAEVEVEEKKEDRFKISNADLEAIYVGYPRKVGKAKGFERARRDIKSIRELNDLAKAVINYRAHCEREKTESKYIKHFSTFIGEWRDWVDPEHGRAEDFSQRAIAQDLGDIFKQEST